MSFSVTLSPPSLRGRLLFVFVAGNIFSCVRGGRGEASGLCLIGFEDQPRPHISPVRVLFILPDEEGFIVESSGWMVNVCSVVEQ